MPPEGAVVRSAIFGLDQALVGPQNGRPPDRSATLGAAAARSAASASSSVKKAGHVGAERHARRAGQRREVDDERRASPRRRAPARRRGRAGPRRRCCRPRPSGPCGSAGCRPAASPRPEMAFSTAGTSRRRRRSRPSAHDHGGEPHRGGGAAHVLLHQAHRGGGLMSSPPVSKQTPLPTSVTFGAPASPQRRSSRRGGRSRRRADRLDHREIRGAERLARDHVTCAAPCGGQVGRPGELGGPCRGPACRSGRGRGRRRRRCAPSRAASTPSGQTSRAAASLGLR